MDLKISPELRDWALYSFKAVGVDLEAMKMPEELIEELVLAWDKVTQRGSDFATAALIVLEWATKQADDWESRQK